MIAKYILGGIAIFIFLLAALDLRKAGRISPARRIHLTVAILFLVMTIVLHFVVPAG